jgi:hypothetical protein
VNSFPTIPTELNWVPLRAKCSVIEVFERLREEAQMDVTEREKIRESEKRSDYHFKFIDGNDTFTIALEGGLDVRRRVRFSLKESHIEITKDDGSSLLASTALNEEGRCVLRINNQNCERWQVRKMALDHLFFEAPQKLLQED